MALQVSGLQAETAQKVLSLPAAPGSYTLNTAGHLHGIMVSDPGCCCFYLLRSPACLRSDCNARPSFYQSGFQIPCISRKLEQGEIS